MIIRKDMEKTTTATVTKTIKTRKRRMTKATKASAAKTTEKVEGLLKSAEKHLHDLRERIAKIDKATAAANLKEFKKQVEELSHAEYDKVKALIEKRLGTLQNDFKNTSQRVKNTFDVLKEQVKHITDSERLKRRARR